MKESLKIALTHSAGIVAASLAAGITYALSKSVEKEGDDVGSGFLKGASIANLAIVAILVKRVASMASFQNVIILMEKSKS